MRTATSGVETHRAAWNADQPIHRPESCRASSSSLPQNGKVTRKAEGGLPGEGQDRESRDFRSAAFVNTDLNQLFTEIGRGITVAEQPQNLIATGAQRQTVGLSSDRKRLPRMAKSRQARIVSQRRFRHCSGRTIAPDPILTMIEFVFRIAR